MHGIDWMIAAVPLVVVLWIAAWARRHVRSVSDFLSAGRIAGRYVLCVSTMEASQGVISLVAIYEAYYQSGFAYSFWGALSVLVSIFLALSGFVGYRFRETRAMTIGQFLEIRYSRRFRVFAGILQFTSGLLNYGLFPAIGSRFFVYFCGLPAETTLFGGVFPTFALVMVAYLFITVLVATTGGQLSIMVADCINAMLSYPLYVFIVGYILWRFSWFRDLAPALLDRPPGKSLLNPFDISELRDFNIFYVLAGIFGNILNYGSWSGNQGFRAAGKNAHEQKMAGVLSTWRNGFSLMMYILVPVVALAYFSSPRFQAGDRGAAACRTELGTKAANDILAADRLAPVRTQVAAFFETGTITPELKGMLDRAAEARAREQASRGAEASPSAAAAGAAATVQVGQHVAAEERRDLARDAIYSADPAASQVFYTISGQMRVPMAVRYILPAGITGMFCAIAIMLLVSTDASYQHSWGSVIVQDIILPNRKRPLSPRQHLNLLRIMILAVAAFGCCFSLFFGQVDYVLMFQAITGAIWMGGCGPCIIGGLYWKRGTTAGAWTALIGGSGLAVLALFAQKYWVSLIYPWLAAHGLVETVGRWLAAASAPFEPIIKWRISPDKFPINSQEVFLIAMLLSLGLYIVISLLTCRQSYNMERMLHRGHYRREGQALVHEPLTWRNILPKLIGIDSQYTRGDRILAWSVFIYSIGWGFLVSFVGVVAWNLISPWGSHGWSVWFYFNNFILAGLIGVVSTVWFTIGGAMDLRRLFRDLKTERRSALDDGRVIGHVSADDLELVEKVDRAGPQAQATDDRPAPV